MRASLIALCFEALALVKAEAGLAREVAEWLARAQAEDVAEDAGHGSTHRGDEPPDWMRDKQARLARIRGQGGA